SGAPPAPPTPVPPSPSSGIFVFREDAPGPESSPSPPSGVFSTPSLGTAPPVPPGPGPVLVVDDNEMNRDMLSRRLSARGFRVTPAPNGREALRLVEAGGFD